MAIPIDNNDSSDDEPMSEEVASRLLLEVLNTVYNKMEIISHNTNDLGRLIGYDLKMRVDNQTKEIEDLKMKVDNIAIKVDAMDAKLNKIIDMLLNLA